MKSCAAGAMSSIQGARYVGPVDQHVEELVEAEGDRGDGEGDPQQQERLVARVVPVRRGVARGAGAGAARSRVARGAVRVDVAMGTHSLIGAPPAPMRAACPIRAERARVLTPRPFRSLPAPASSSSGTSGSASRRSSIATPSRISRWMVSVTSQTLTFMPASTRRPRARRR
jgi:hypothetical protein